MKEKAISGIYILKPAEQQKAISIENIFPKVQLNNKIKEELNQNKKRKI